MYVFTFPNRKSLSLQKKNIIDQREVWSRLIRVIQSEKLEEEENLLWEKEIELFRMKDKLSEAQLLVDIVELLNQMEVYKFKFIILYYNEQTFFKYTPTYNILKYTKYIQSKNALFLTLIIKCFVF